jgi:hypothetical protein
VRAVLADPAARDMAAIAAAQDACFDSADYREGRRAFMEKRQPRPSPPELKKRDGKPRTGFPPSND